MPSRRETNRGTRVLLIGAGKMGSAYARVLSETPNVELVAIASRGGDSAKKLAKRFHGGAFGTDWRALARDEGAEACIVAVSHNANESMTAEVISEGLHVLAEKPVAFSSSAVSRLAAMAKERKVIAMAGMNRRFYRNVLAAIDEIRFAGGLLGVTAIASDPVRQRRAKSTHESFVYDRWTIAQTLHLIDLLRLIAGEQEELLAAGTCPSEDGEGNLAALMRFSSGALVSYIGFSSSPSPWELRLHGASAEARLSPLEEGTITLGSRSKRLPSAGTRRDGPRPGLRDQTIAFLEAISGGTLAYPASSLEDHARSVGLAEMIEQYASAGRDGRATDERVSSS